MEPCAAVVVTVLLGYGPGAPQGPPTHLDAVETEIVRLDAVITDSDGRLVQNLSQKDFVLLEDGKPQALRNLVFVSRPSGGPNETTPPEQAAERPAEAPRPAGGLDRQIVILVDDLHIVSGNLQYTKAALLRLVDEFTAVDDNIALLTTSLPGTRVGFTRDRGLLKRAIDRLTVRDSDSLPITALQLTPVEAELILRGDRNALKLAARTLLYDPTSPLLDVGLRASAAASGGRVPADMDSMEAVAADEAQRQARGALAEALYFSSVTLRQLDEVVRGPAERPGRKICLLVSDGFLVGAGTPDERTYDLRRVIDAATRSGAVVYSLDARGVVTTVTHAGVAGQSVSPGLREFVARQGERLTLSTLATVAGDTGGFLVHGTNDLAGGLRRLMEDNTAYYLMAYQPSNTKHDGKFRRIELRLPQHPDYTVRTHKGYLAPDDRLPGRPVVRAQAGGAPGARRRIAARDERNEPRGHPRRPLRAAGGRRRPESGQQRLAARGLHCRVKGGPPGACPSARSGVP